jgi:hypothetical protein
VAKPDSLKQFHTGLIGFTNSTLGGAAKTAPFFSRRLPAVGEPTTIRKSKTRWVLGRVKRSWNAKKGKCAEARELELCVQCLNAPL